jgi:hypothetical protein
VGKWRYNSTSQIKLTLDSQGPIPRYQLCRSLGVSKVGLEVVVFRKISCTKPTIELDRQGPQACLHRETIRLFSLYPFCLIVVLTRGSWAARSIATYGPRNTHRYTEIVNLKTQHVHDTNIANIIRGTEPVRNNKTNLTTSYKTA